MKRLAALGAMRLSLAIMGRVEESVFEKYKNILSKEVTEEAVLTAESVGFEMEEPPRYVKDTPEQRVNVLMRMIGDDPVARSLAELASLLVIEPSASEILDIVAPGNVGGVTLQTAARAAGYFGKNDEIILPCRNALNIVRFLFKNIEKDNTAFFNEPYMMDDWLLGFLSGSDEIDRVFSDFADIPEESDLAPDIFGMEDEVENLARRLEKICFDEDTIEYVNVIISGERESGRFTAVRAISHEFDIPLITVDFDYLLGTSEPKEVFRRIVRSASLMGRSLVIRNIKKAKDTEFIIERIQRLYEEYCSLPLFLLTEPDVKLVPSIRGPFVAMKIPTGASAALALWKGYLPDECKGMADSLASKMLLTAGQVKRVTDSMKTRILAGETVDEHLICKLCYEVLDDGRYENIKRVEPGFSLDDLKIDPHNRAVLEDICHQVELRRQVYDGWDLKKKYAYGRCVSVILAGPPGTGKTMTVHALAGQLGLELYKVDLSQIVDKYVGETEKRLEEVFTKAQKSNMILFFDEADAVMGKRSEVKEAKDKYANTEISFILQRIEEYDGIVLLATNNLQNIDTAFMRRIRYVLSFMLPDKATRKEIWKSAFGKSVPLDNDIDYDFLAEKFELSGGEIKNIVLNAVFYGASDGGKVGMAHIMKAVYRENTKLKRIAFDGDYGGYAYLLHD